ncbi:transcription factor bHLH168-like [Dioscorea cayenensis subsp. rotundata]|uniref:Transcription factor bHLH168-like n=1 Tax=Dioscorea cayennensis subsp. rotundata TaxID=55577 RepID=A0AB40B6U6_DIOCR|nr:transcription factor bHLH168-like [Dioscorea cayenensis subsp. rotundata]
MEGGRQAQKLERKTVEKNRRLLMKGLYSQLSFLIPKTQTSGSKDALPQRDLLEEAASYIKKLQGKIESLKRKRKVLWVNMQGIHMDVTDDDHKFEVQVRVKDVLMEVVLLSGLKKGLKLHHVFSILEEEGAEVINANFSTVGDKIIHTIHSQAISSRIGLEEKRIKERLEGLVLMANESNSEGQKNKKINYLDDQMYYDN